jgi:hypothetical protein
VTGRILSIASRAAGSRVILRTPAGVFGRALSSPAVVVSWIWMVFASRSTRFQR